MVDDDFSTLKAHGEWFRRRTGSPFSDRTPASLERHWHEQGGREGEEDRGPAWECMGPFEIAGRTPALAVHPTDQQTLFAGSANGGVWRSRNGGADWEWKWLRWGATAIGALAFDPQDHNTLYAATGEANGSVDAYPGSGIYVTHDLGDNWNLLARAGRGKLPRRIGALVAHPAKPGVLWLGGASHDESEPAGLYYSQDSGKTWERENFFSHRNYTCHSIVFCRDGAALAAIDCGGLQTGIWRHTGRRWQQLADGLPSGDTVGRISLAASWRDPYPVYALVASRSGKRVLGVYRGTESGRRWQNIAGDQFASEGSLSYNNAIAVSPEDPDSVVCGGKDLHITRDAGATWRQASRWQAEEGSRHYVHADQHHIAIPAGDLIYVANDGGVARSDNFGESWKMVVRGMATTMFFDMDVCPHNAGLYGGGAQDNGCLLVGDASASGSVRRLLGGDGSALLFDPRHLGHAYAARTDVHLVRHTQPHHWAEDTWEACSPHAMKDAEHRQNAFTIIGIDPDQAGTVWTGTQRMWRSLDGGHHWEPKSERLDGTGITAIEVAGRTVFAGTCAGGIFRSEDGGETWSGDLSGPEIPARLITRIETHPKHPRQVAATVAGSGTVSVAPRLDEKINHVFYSEDNGSSWRPLDPPDHPDVACHAAVFERIPPYRLYIANDCGVWQVESLRHFKLLDKGLPNALITDLVYHGETRTLWAATYGRGIWKRIVS